MLTELLTELDMIVTKVMYYTPDRLQILQG